MTTTSATVRCEVFGRQGDVELDEVLAFLRGFSALYGAGLALHSETFATAAEVGEQAALALESPGVTRVGDESHTPQLFARVSTPQQTLVVVGASTLKRWMRQQLLETRYCAAATATEATAEHAPLRIFVSGDRAQVGKSTMCLGLVGALLRAGYAAEELAYIKPATQCEKPQLVTKFCRQQGVAYCEVGPILFYKGFTREFLRGETDSASTLLDKARLKVEEVGRGKKVVVVDGVGYPAVGSICGVSNAHVAKKLEVPVVLVGKKGVGDAVDSFNLNAAFFESHGVKVLGGIFNRLPEDGFYSLEHCKENVTAYFEQFQPDKHVYGFLPELTDGGHSALIAEKAGEDGQDEPALGVFLTPAEDELAKKVVDMFVQHIDLTKLLADAEAHQGGGGKKQASVSGTKPQAAKPKAKKPKRARKFEIPTSFETVSLPAFDTVAAPTSLNSVEIPSSTETVALPTFNNIEIPTSTETMALPPFDTVEIPGSTETMALPPFDTVEIPGSTETLALPPFDTVEIPGSTETMALPPFDTVAIPTLTDTVPI
ncbi:hypothetical protein PF010_g23505 [Phytophthora fragariae]|uniref:DRTGG domain-containing protein n=1 Tax=Phytophthora fragariae TaxID=53985 RepID=A0A6G0K5S3_9STRA|nr:hypothetical protein PF010_g23505 [Phytophthora fragariae]KAE9187013.1 hypothetical protein PF004_g22923 [Phytophthora fragariae]